ncbi:TPA: 50S ribosomal protein L10 [Candidatus Poribacteria bacterium]|nr:50S ribosomal protein L10 [Candidatus Poribacteria bacterium]
MPSQKNIETLKEIKQKFAAAETVILTDYQGLNVGEINELRRRFRESNVEYKVYKNTLMNLAANELDIQGLDQYLEGPTAVAMSQNVAAPVNVINDFIKEFQKLTIKVGLLGTKVIPAEDVDDLLKMPTKDELISSVLGQLQAPIASLLGTLQQSAPMLPLVRVLNQISPMTPLTITLQNIVNNFTYVLQAIATQKEQTSEST